MSVPATMGLTTSTPLAGEMRTTTPIGAGLPHPAKIESFGAEALFRDGSYYYKNPNNSTYHDDAKGRTRYTAPNGSERTTYTTRDHADLQSNGSLGTGGQDSGYQSGNSTQGSKNGN